MSVRDVIEKIDVEVFKEEIRHDEVVEFLRKMGVEDRPVVINVEGWRVAKNFISTRELLCRYLGVRKEELARYLASVRYERADVELSEDSPWKAYKGFDLRRLPAIKYFKGDGGRYITAGVLIARLPWSDPLNPESYNASIHRLMVKGRDKLVARVVPPRHTYLMWRECVDKGESLPVAIAIGVHPLVLFSSATRVPEGMEFRYASAIMGGLRLYIYGDMLIPDAEVVILGRMVDRREEEGPFVDITGTYDKVRLEPVIEVEEVLMKDDPIFYSITPAGKEHQILMGIPYEPVIYRSVSRVCKVINVVMTPGSRHYFHAVVQIKKETEGDGKNAIIAALAANPSLKGVIVVDDDIDVYSYEDVEYAIATRFQADRDLVVIKGARGSSLDPSADGTTAKWGIDATKKIGRERDFERVV